MNAFLFVVTGLVVLVAPRSLRLPICKEKEVEKRLRIIGVCLTVSGGILGAVIGLGLPPNQMLDEEHRPNPADFRENLERCA
jgi:uncharacterized protein YjeT (DUF2065 family)